MARRAQGKGGSRTGSRERSGRAEASPRTEPRRARGFERLLSLAGDDDPARRSVKIRAFRQLVLLHGMARSWMWLGVPTLDATVVAVTAIGLSFALGVSFTRKYAYRGPRIALPLVALQLVATFPLSDNHFYLELLCLLLLSVVGPDGGKDENLALQGLQWMTALVLFQSGLQKVFYGHYFQGDFLAFMIGRGGRFADLFQLVLPASEIARLQSYDAIRTGAGPYRVDSMAIVLAANVIWIAEMVLGVLLILRRTRTVAAIASIVLMIGVQLGAREVAFALLFVSLLLLFLPTRLIRTLLPLFAAIYAYAIAAAAGLVPGGSLIDASSL